MIRFLKIATTWSIPGWTAISLFRWHVAYQDHSYRTFDECYMHVGRVGFYDQECKAAMEIIYQAELSTVWNHWWILTIILCLFWFMVRYANLKTQKEEPDEPTSTRETL